MLLGHFVAFGAEFDWAKDMPVSAIPQVTDICEEFSMKYGCLGQKSIYGQKSIELSST